MTPVAPPVKVVAILSARAGKADAVRALLSGTRKLSRTEPGNLRWDIWQDQTNPDRFVLDELYTDRAAAAAHRETPHFKNYDRKINDLADRTPMVLDPVEVG